MTTKSENTATINAPIDKVYAALSTREYWDYEAQNVGDEAGEVASFTGAPTIEAVMHEVLPASALPEAVRGMIPQALKLKRTVTFGPLEDDKTTGDVTAEVKGAPVIFRSDLTLSGEGETTLLSADSAISVNIPMMGGVLEPKVAEWVQEFFTEEAALIEKWVAEH
ncbi:DUF2505 domain-containing protein [Corynebacterium heidelbergense]|uniref:DUF2505 domain-containing protein n=1 Tax=Corynebacterium heidelbergense TaxID=2055947 RepID=A0A364VEF7_9CORY|nr:DUF2505 domain-containing protein [Corynebacterium heidelbergense]RAV35035.1 DUF2505 domain-containing protein [Corynebacterium heidelbergense]WCZ37416.1 hypothetical protein CHEID_09450 [Corynebacterium heidelbergense]